MSARTTDSTRQVCASDLKASRWSQAAADNYQELSQHFRRLAETAVHESNANEAAALSLLADLCGMGIDNDTGKGPFQPMLRMHGRRSLLPEDLGVDELNALVALLDETQLQPLVRARVADVAWLCVKPRNPDYARMAIDAYAASWPLPSNWFHGRREEWVRAVQLCFQLRGDCRPRLAAMESTLVDLVCNAPDSGACAFTRSVAEVLRVHRLANAHAVAIAQRLSELGEIEQNDHADMTLSRELLLESGRWYKRIGDDASCARTTSAAAQTRVLEGDFYASSEGTGYLMAGSSYEAAVQLLRSVPRLHRAALNVDSRIADLRRKVRESNERSLDAMNWISGPSVDLREQVEAARAAVTGKRAWDALTGFVRLSSPLPASHWHKQASTAIRDFPLQALFTSSRLSSDGRLIARNPGLNLGDETSDGWKSAVHDRAVQSFTTYQSLVVAGGIIPALEAMRLEHNLLEADFIEIAARSPVVPPDRERLFGRGLCAGYRSEFDIAIHLLAPQLEHLVRVHIVAVGGETRKLDESGIETEVGLSALMDMPEADKVFGEALSFELRATFCDSAGPNIRNVIAHGLADDGAIVSSASVYAWWFCLRLVLLPLMHKERDT